MVQSNDIERQVEEIKVNVPWGHIAGKWWGPKSIRPIVCIHGWQDNAASFDPLIVQLPDHLSYLAIDLPGHGLSSRIPDGMTYSLENYIFSLMLICNYFGWEKVSLMSHSGGSVVCFLFAATFPGKCDMVIGFDTLRPYNDEFNRIYTFFANGLNKALKADIRNREETEPPSYTYEELLERLKWGTFMNISETAASYLLQRGAKASKDHNDKYYFTRDSRLKASAIPMMAHDISKLFARNIISPYCFIRASRTLDVEKPTYHNEILQIMLQNPYFESHNVVGDHHVHLNEPNKVSGIITTFINKYRPASVTSKL